MKQFTEGVFEAMLEHCRSQIDVEVGGLLVGTLSDDEAHVAVTLPALEAAAGTANVTFTHEVWDSVLNTIETEYPQYRIVGWYHTHPRFGVFMSNYDQFIQQNFFSDPRLLGIVIDPIKGKGGTFSCVDGEVKQVDSYDVEAVIDSLQEGIEAQVQRRDGRSRWIFAVPALLLAGLLGGYFLGGSTSLHSSSATTTVPSQPVVVGKQTSPTDCVLTLRVPPNGTYWALAEIIFGNGSKYPLLQAANGSKPLYANEIVKAVVPLSICDPRPVSHG